MFSIGNRYCEQDLDNGRVAWPVLCGCSHPLISYIKWYSKYLTDCQAIKLRLAILNQILNEKRNALRLKLLISIEELELFLSLANFKYNWIDSKHHFKYNWVDWKHWKLLDCLQHSYSDYVYFLMLSALTRSFCSASYSISLLHFFTCVFLHASDRRHTRWGNHYSSDMEPGSCLPSKTFALHASRLSVCSYEI